MQLNYFNVIEIRAHTFIFVKILRPYTLKNVFLIKCFLFNGFLMLVLRIYFDLVNL